METGSASAVMRDDAARKMLVSVDRTLAFAIPLLVVSAAIDRPADALMWVCIGGGVIALIAVFGRYARKGGARWRGTAYAAISLPVALLTLWVGGPITGTGALFGLSMLLAGAFLDKRWLAAFAGIAMSAIMVRVELGGARGLEGAIGDFFPIKNEFWIATALTCGSVLWIAIRMMTVLMASLQASRALAEEALAAEAAALRTLDDSRQELEDLAKTEMMGRLAGGVAHDVNNALAAVLAAADVLRYEVQTAEQRRDLTELEAASHNAAELVRDLLSTGRRRPPPTASAMLAVTLDIPVRVRTALIVEDEPMVLRRLRQLVERRGYEVSTASTVADALEKLEAGPDLLITDLQLPDGSGEEVALRSFALSPKRRIIVCSGFSEEDIVRGPLRDAPLTFLPKPFTSAELDALLKRSPTARVA